MKTIAFIDLGSNSVRFIIIQINEDNGSYKLIYQQKEAVRLSEGLSANNELTLPAIDRTLFALKAFAKSAAHMGVSHTIAVATAAVRLAKNGQYFIDRVYKETGFKLKAISGLEEAKYGYLGVINTVNLEDFVLFDLGGASIEVTLVKNRMIKESHSFPIGALTVTEQFKSGSELTPDEIKAMRFHINSLFSEKKWLKNLKLPIVGIGGTVRNIAKMDQRKRDYPIHKLHNYELDLATVKSLLEEVSNKTLAQRKKISGLSVDRADIIVPGIHIINELINYSGGTSLYVSGCGLREGLFYDYYGKYYRQGQIVCNNVLLESVQNFLNTLHMNEYEHIDFVRHFSSILFTQWYPLHTESQRTKELLEAAALLHDTGKKINYYSHARHSAYILLNAPIYGLTHREQTICAFIAGFSHGADMKTPRSFLNAKLLTPDDWITVRRISLILAIAEALDESYEQGVMFIESTIGEKIVNLAVHVKEGTNTALFLFKLEKLKKQFKKEFRRTLQVSIDVVLGSGN